MPIEVVIVKLVFVLGERVDEAVRPRLQIK